MSGKANIWSPRDKIYRLPPHNEMWFQDYKTPQRRDAMPLKTQIQPTSPGIPREQAKVSQRQMPKTHHRSYTFHLPYLYLSQIHMRHLMVSTGNAKRQRLEQTKQEGQQTGSPQINGNYSKKDSFKRPSRKHPTEARTLAQSEAGMAKSFEGFKS